MSADLVLVPLDGTKKKDVGKNFYLTPACRGKVLPNAPFSSCRCFMVWPCFFGLLQVRFAKKKKMLPHGQQLKTRAINFFGKPCSGLDFFSHE